MERSFDFQNRGGIEESDGQVTKEMRNTDAKAWSLRLLAKLQ